MIHEGKTQGWLQLPVGALLPWATLNNVLFNGITVGTQAGLEDRGYTIIATRELSTEHQEEPLMTVPQDLILSLERVREHTKYDRDLRDVIESLGDFGQVSGHAILFYVP